MLIVKPALAEFSRYAFSSKLMKTFLKIIFLVTFTSQFVYAQKTSSAVTSALQLLKNREPKVKCNSRSLLKADFDYDGVVDYALAGKKADLFVVGVVKGSLSNKFKKHWTLEFSQDASSQSALCSVGDAKISLEQFSADDEIRDVRNLPKKSRGVNLSDKRCDAFHIYYNQREKQFAWWRR